MSAADTYLALRTVHITAVALSGTGFAIRWLASLRDAAWLQERAAKVLPQVVDTVLLAAALGMLAASGLRPWNAPWITAKIVALLVYIALGVVALKPARSRGTRAVAGLAALVVFAWIVSVAITKQPTGFLGGFA